MSWAEHSTGRRAAWIIGALAAVAMVAGAIFDRQRFFEAYLYAFLFLLGLSLGPLVLAMIAQVTGGRWGQVVRRPALAAAGVLPVLAVLFVPLLFGLQQLYPWTVGLGAPQHLLNHKEPYLNVGFFIVRAALYFAIWISLAFVFRSRLYDAELRDTPHDWQRVRMVSAAGLLLYGLTGTLAAIDWVMSLLPVWYSTVFGAQVLAVQMLAATAVVVLGSGRSGEPRPIQMRPQDYHDLGNLMLVFTLLWAYLAYSDFVTIWIADLPHETEWYRQRSVPLWEGLGISVWVLQFALPFALLLFRAVKRNASRMRSLAIAVLIGSALNVYWLVMPCLRPHDNLLSWLDWVAPLALGAVWFAMFLVFLDRDERRWNAHRGVRTHAEA